MWQGIIVAAIVCLAIVYLFRRHYRALRSPDPCAGCSSCCDSSKRNACEGIADFRHDSEQADSRHTKQGAE